MTEWDVERDRLLKANAGAFAGTALSNVVREYPHHESHWHVEGVPILSPRQSHPCFYGSFDWHSCVEMFWVLVRLLRHHAELVPAEDIRECLNEHLTIDALAGEVAFFAPEEHRTTQRPYGWSALLELAFETATWDDPDAARWSAALKELNTVFVTRYLGWLPRTTYPIRYGVHDNGAFGLSRALPYACHLAEQGDSRLRDVIVETAWRWFGSDQDYPGAWEPSGADFLSPALAEAELMSRLLPAAEFAEWLDRFLPGIAERKPSSLFTPATVTDPSDGQLAHLHGLNLHRAWCWQRLAHTLPEGDGRIPAILGTTHAHTHASLSQTTGGAYMVEHFLAYYALLLLG
ncbi:DUF2891 domain-containing protein [Amycolatopsis sp. WAC 01376]|uniref:DUF2891 domain-containing protein n=1 Tax=Amycolatopsis sp. WAC 01376 TaxID=2203195 RepID=UPI000F76F647|nr:DUF2891 domain-containing protein [Amycolatopsis sp. WAC 01376]RSM56120.1 DUF2891 domain-containing protein [Amycolatopsis sp. WAC 01376]